MWLFTLFMAACSMTLAAKDGISYKLKDKNPSNIPLALKLIKWWHGSGVVLSALFVLPFLYFDLDNWWKYLIYALGARLALYDLTFNKVAGLDITYLGKTSGLDRLFSKVFGSKGAVKKSLFFLIITVLLNIFLK